jgi:hypothetical protein
VALARARSVPVTITTKWELNHVAGNRPHQGLLLGAAPVPTQPLTALTAVVRSSPTTCAYSAQGHWHHRRLKGGGYAPLSLSFVRVRAHLSLSISMCGTHRYAYGAQSPAQEVLPLARPATSPPLWLALDQAGGSAPSCDTCTPHV